MTTDTKQKLAKALLEYRAPAWMVDKALEGYYHDYETPLATPIVQLVNDARRNGLNDIATMAITGHFDATSEEAEAWFQREGKDLLRS